MLIIVGFICILFLCGLSFTFFLKRLVEDNLKKKMISSSSTSLALSSSSLYSSSFLQSLSKYKRITEGACENVYLHVYGRTKSRRNTLGCYRIFTRIMTCFLVKFNFRDSFYSNYKLGGGGGG